MILHNLMKVYKELYFRNYNRKGYKLAKTVQAILKLNETEYSGDTLDIIKDIKTINDGKNNVISSQAKVLIETINIAERKVKTSLSMVSDITLTLMHDLISQFEGNTYIVGGFVRDSIAGFKSNDIDFCTDISYDILANKLQKIGWTVKVTGKQFLVMNVSTKNSDEVFEIAVLRKDKDNSGAEIGTIEEDAQRRDFTIGAIYFDIRTKKLIDPNGTGIQDCNNKELKFIGKANERIQEDSIRVFRFFRFIGRGWNANSKSLKNVREHWNKACDEANNTRIRLEIEKMVGI